MATKKKAKMTPLRHKAKPARKATPKKRVKARAVTPRKPAAGAAPRTLPAMEVETTGGKRLKLSSLKGRPVVLYFYPKDDTPGCTQEGCDLRDHHAEFAGRKAVVLGVSRDSLASHEKFKAKYGFPFDLISDPDEKLCRAFDVIREKSLYGRKYLGIERSTFLYDRQGRLRGEFRGVKVAGHAAKLQMELDNL